MKDLHKLYNILLFVNICVVIYPLNGYTQTPPDDQNWELNTTLSDEFDGTTFKDALWKNPDNGLHTAWGNWIPNCWSMETKYPHPIVVELDGSGNLKLTAREEKMCTSCLKDVFGYCQTDENLNIVYDPKEYIKKTTRVQVSPNQWKWKESTVPGCTEYIAPNFASSPDYYPNYNWLKRGKYKYGYMEVSCKVMDPSNIAENQKGIHFDFWLFGGEARPDDKDYWTTSKPPIDNNEIDFPEAAIKGSIFTSNFHFEPSEIYIDPNTNKIEKTKNLALHHDFNKYNNLSYNNINLLSQGTGNRYGRLYEFNYNSTSQYNTYSTEWNANFATVFYNKQYVQSTANTTWSNFMPFFGRMGMILDIVAPMYCYWDPNEAYPTHPFCEQVDVSTQFPEYILIDYVRYWTLKDHTNQPGVNIHNNTDLDNYSYGVKTTINVDNTVIHAWEKVAFRATQVIELHEGFEVELGGDFYANVHELKEN
jgi:hypothetical protein